MEPPPGIATPAQDTFFEPHPRRAQPPRQPIATVQNAFAGNRSWPKVAVAESGAFGSSRGLGVGRGGQLTGAGAGGEAGKAPRATCPGAGARCHLSRGGCWNRRATAHNLSRGGCRNRRPTTHNLSRGRCAMLPIPGRVLDLRRSQSPPFRLPGHPSAFSLRRSIWKRGWRHTPSWNSPLLALKSPLCSPNPRSPSAPSPNAAAGTSWPATTPTSSVSTRVATNPSLPPAPPVRRMIRVGGSRPATPGSSSG